MLEFQVDYECIFGIIIVFLIDFIKSEKEDVNDINGPPIQIQVMIILLDEVVLSRTTTLNLI